MKPLPEGTPVLLNLGFGAPAIPVLEVGTRTEATAVDEAHVHDLYVFIFKEDGSKLYGRFFSYEHQVSKSELNDAERECWFVENQTINGVTPYYAQTRGAAKIATASQANCTIVVLANVSNTLTKLDGDEPVVRLNQIQTLEQLQTVKVHLTQDIVARKDYFLMMAMKTGVHTGDMRWNEESTTNYNSSYQINLKRVDAKVKFRIKANPDNISNINPRFWQVCKAPSSCYLFDSEDGGPDSLNPADDEKFESFEYFDTEETHFDGTETIDGEEYKVFSFYMLENRLRPIRSATQYANREEQNKVADTDHPGYVKNDKWKYANENSTYVRFDVILTLEREAIEDIAPDAHQAMTTDVAFVVHLGDFVNSDRKNEGLTHDFNNYNTDRGTCYTYNVTINNSKSIHTEVTTGVEVDPAQEGFLLLIKDGVVNCDAHYEYRSIVFNYRDTLNPLKFSWYVKTPFNEGGARTVAVDAEAGIYYYPAPDSIVDYQWVLFEIDSLDAGTGKYRTERRAFPGMGAYRPSWKLVPGAALADSLSVLPKLMDITQLISYIFYQQAAKKAGNANIFDSDNVIWVTAFVNEYYYETNPETGEVDKELWRKFVNAKPREMHILSDTQTSLDRKSDVISSSQSLIQQSIQTIYNVYEPELSSIWGTEHKDEMRNLAGEYGWGYGSPSTLSGEKDNGRKNSAIMWDANGATPPDWNAYVNYLVDNDMPELLDDGHRAMVYSCMTRNRDNNGNGKIDKEEVRWYLAAINQLIGMYIGGDALSKTAQLYQPFPGQWRAHVVSSTNSGGIRVLTSEEGTSHYELNGTWMNFKDSSSTGGPTVAEQTNRIRSVRCLRNVGTYVQGGVRRDISNAPLDSVPNKYYTVETTGTGDAAYYTFRFNRLDPKALRPLSTGELPFHDEHSAHNKVYLQMITQSKDQAVVDTLDVEMKDVNPIITNAGTNPYCPAGYRIPNQVELSLMSAALPGSYFSSVYCAISRTYYSRGNYAAPGEQVASEANKTGFGYNGTKMFCVNNHHEKAIYTRCVKDSDLTGTIMGDMLIPTDPICPGEKVNVDFKFSSSASSFSYASLRLCYTVGGVYKEKEILLDKEPTGVQYVHTQDITIPSLAALGFAEIPEEGIPMTLRFQIRNAGGREITVNKDILLQATHLTAYMRLLPGWKDGEGFPVEISARSTSRRYPVSGVTFSTKVGSGEWSGDDLLGGDRPRLFKDTIYVFPSPTAGATYYVRMTATCSDGTSFRYEGSIDILRANFTPATDAVDNIWEDTATGLDFIRGDFIETKVSLPTENPTPKQGIISIGYPTIKHFSYSDYRRDESPAQPFYAFHCYYQQNANDHKLRIGVPHGTETYGSTNPATLTSTDLTLRFDNGGLYYNNTRINAWDSQGWYADFLSTITSYSSMYVGQNQGMYSPQTQYRSESTYPYIRVVHQAEEVAIP